MRIVDLGGDYLTRIIQQQHALDDAERPDGLHLSAIIHDYMQTLYPNWYKQEFEEEQKRALYEMGNVFEDVMAAGLRRSLNFEKPKPRKVDGVWMSPDGYNASRRRIDEIKFTTCSSRDGLAHPKLKKYLMQTLAYMYGWEAERARIHVFYVMGDYAHKTKAGRAAGNQSPLARPHTYLLIPSMQDILENKNNLWQHAKDRGML